MAIDPLPVAPTLNDPVDFPAQADAFVAAMNTFRTQVNAALALLNSPSNNRTVDVVVASNIGIAGGAGNLIAGTTVDGVALVAGMRALLVAQTTGSQNGIYDVPASGAASRSIDANSAALIPTGLNIYCTRGTLGAGATVLHNTAPGFTLGTTALTFAPLSHTKLNTVQTKTSGSGATFTPSNWFVKYTKARWCGGGGGGGGGFATANGANGGSGGTTTVNGINAAGAGGGRGGNPTGNVIGGVGGINGTGTATFRSGGQGGNSGNYSSAGCYGGCGGSSALGGGGLGGIDGVSGEAARGYGGGGGGVQSGPNNFSGSGGGGGEYAETVFTGTCTYTIGAGGAGGVATNSYSGGDAKAGVAIFEECYN